MFRFRLNRPARVKLRFSRIARGGKVKPRGVLWARGTRGPNSVRFRGKIGDRHLTPGRYRLTVTAHAAGESSARASIGFTIARSNTL